MSDNDLLVSRFCGVTGVNRERATFYLQAAGWNLEVRCSVLKFIVALFVALSGTVSHGSVLRRCQ